MDVFEAIHARRSVGKMTAERPPRADIERLLAAAVEAPNHHQTEPWRFIVLAGAAREAFGEVLAEALRRRAGREGKDLEGLVIAEQAKPLRAPVLVVVGVKHDVGGGTVRSVEDLEACAAATENMLLAAHAMGLAAHWRTGDAAFDPFVKAWLGLEPADEIAAIVYVGYRDPEHDVPRTRSRSSAEKTEWRGWD